MIITKKIVGRLIVIAVVLGVLVSVLEFDLTSTQADVDWVPKGSPNDNDIELLGQMAAIWDGFKPAPPPSFIEAANVSANDLELNEPITTSK